jgi:AAA domain/UvrD-like helicase C-terminal domain
MAARRGPAKVDPSSPRRYVEPVSHPDLQTEQAYVDLAYDHLERMRLAVTRAGDAVDGEVAQAAMDAWAARRLRTYEDAERGLCFGRLDFEQLARPLYIGRRWVHDEDQQQVVVNWQAPAARPFYTATPHDPQGVTLRRRFRTDGRRLIDIADEALDGSMLDGATVGDFLLDELERSRGRHMRDIVATIQTDQYRLITHDPTVPLVIQGGPGTGKTAVGLHRASWLLYTLRENMERRGVLVIGPNRTFMEYVSHVLPALGENAVEQRAVGELVDGVEAELRDPPAVAELKADLRLAEVVQRAAELRLVSEPEELVIRLEGSFIAVRLRDVRELLGAAREQLGTTSAARERFRMSLLRRFYEEYGRVLGGAAFRDFDEVEQALRRNGYLDSVVKAAWPVVSPDRLVRSLLTSKAALAEAADGILSPAEQTLLYRRGAAWSDGDIPLIDEARTRLATRPRAYGHVIVDEAQDLTPMQLRMVSRRAREGSLTILGDVAQATGAIPYSSWDDVLPHLPGGGAAVVEELLHAYRVPREIMEVALPLLDTIAPGVAPPISYRTGADPPTFRRVAEEHLLAEAFHEAERLAGADGLLAVIVPEELADAVLAGTPLYESVPLLTPRQAKGLEFDHVVVVEPALIAASRQGLRELYVALTRPTKTLVVVHARPLPAELRGSRLAQRRGLATGP